MTRDREPSSRRRVNSPRRASASSVELEFNRRYLEATFDRLFRTLSSDFRSSWWPDLANEFRTAIARRQEAVWTNGTAPDTGFHVPENLLDELLWQLASSLRKLYETAGWDHPPSGKLKAEPIELSIDRYILHLAASGLPLATAEGRFPFATWEAFVRDWVREIYTDFLLWSVQRAYPELTVRAVLLRLGEPLQNRALRHERSLPDDWLQRWSEAIYHDSSEHDISLSRSDLDHLSNLIARIVERTIEPPDELLRVPSYRLGIIEDLLAGLLESLESSPDISDVEYLSYFADMDRRRPIEERISSELATLLQGATYEVVLPVPGQLQDDLAAPELGFTITTLSPVSDSDFTRPSGAYIYAHFTDVHASSVDEAVQTCRRFLAVVISAVGVLSRTPVSYVVEEAFFRQRDWSRWGFSGRHTTFPLRVIAPHWSPTLRPLTEILKAEDDLARRIQAAFLYLHRAESSEDPEDCIAAAWQMLEIIGEHASKAGVALLCYLPLMFVPADFGERSSAAKTETVREKYQTILRPFLEIQRARHNAIVHRRLVRADWKVLEHHAAWAKSFARQVLIASVYAWKSGTRRAKDLPATVATAYLKTYHYALPKPADLRGSH